MAFEMALWRVAGAQLERLSAARLDQEQRLEDWIFDDPSVLGLEVALIGRQIQTAYGGRIDLLGVDRDGNSVLLELKRDRTPRDIARSVAALSPVAVVRAGEWRWCSGCGRSEKVRRRPFVAIAAVRELYDDRRLVRVSPGSAHLVNQSLAAHVTWRPRFAKAQSRHCELDLGTPGARRAHAREEYGGCDGRTVRNRAPGRGRGHQPHVRRMAAAV